MSVFENNKKRSIKVKSNNMNKILHILLCTVALLCSTVAHAQNFDYGPYKYSVLNSNAKTVYVNGLVNPQTATVNVPATVTYNSVTYQVTNIYPRAFSETSDQHYITSVTLPASLKTVGVGAFKNCTLLKSVVFQATEMTAIQSDAFRDCISLETVQMPGRLTTLAGSTFYGCAKLQSMTIPEGVRAIESTTFNNCRSLASLTLPSTLETIMKYSLGLCPALKKLHIPAGVKTIEGGSFREDSGLEEITVDASNSYFISKNGVLFDKAMKRLILFPPKVPVYEKFNAYYVVPGTVTHIDDYAFDDYPYTHVTLPSGLLEIGEDAFLNGKLIEVTIPASVQHISRDAFSRDNATVYMMSVTPPTTDDTNIKGHTVYVKPSALANYQAHPIWKEAKLMTEIPLDVKEGWNTRCFDFDVQCPTDGTVTPYAVTAFDPSVRSTTLTPFAGGYIPSRQGQGNNEFVGVLLKVNAGGNTVKVTMGEKDYMSGNQTTYTGKNYLVGATVPTFVTVKETRNGTLYTNFGLSNGEFRLLSKDGLTTPSKWNRAYLGLPLGTSSSARSFSFFINTLQTTGIESLKTETSDDAWYTLSGMRVNNPQHGIYIHKGRRILVP
uniref:Leucine-rich repeat domain-containing protein n=1 Tax=Prevotella sp. GTC17254 TaxID=3236794 RepID=A0AB33J7D4_9BACT